MNWLIAVAVLVLVGFLLDREIFFYEGVHLGPRLQAWLYDRWSRKYDDDKGSSQLRDGEMLAVPLLEALQNVPAPFLLDFAAGTGRLSYALLGQPEFTGHIIALDLSQGMLQKAAAKLSPYYDRVELLRHASLPLPFPDATFDAVCALEVLELFPNMAEPLRELTRVLRPGGILLASRGTEESGRRAKVKSPTELVSLLEANGMEKIQITKWWKLFDRVMAVRPGWSHSLGARRLSEAMRCSDCNQIRWQKEGGAMKCQICGRKLSITEDGIVLN